MSEFFGSPVAQEEEEFTVSLGDAPVQQPRNTDSVRDFSVPNGVYVAKCLSVEQNTSQAGNQQFVFRFVGLESEAKGKEFYLYAPLTGKGIFKTREVLAAFGLNNSGDIKFKRADVLNKNVDLTLEKDKPFNGKINSRITRVATQTKEFNDSTVPF